MMEVIIGIVIIVISIFFLVYKATGTTKPEPRIRTQEVKESVPENVVKQEPILEDSNDKIVNFKDYLVNSFRKDRELRNVLIYEGGRYILQYNDKGIYFGILTNLLEKDPKFMSKNVEQDVVADTSYSVDKKYYEI
jgi:hypothetical protein